MKEGLKKWKSALSKLHQQRITREKTVDKNFLFVNGIKKTVQTLAYVRKEYNCL